MPNCKKFVETFRFVDFSWFVGTEVRAEKHTVRKRENSGRASWKNEKTVCISEEVNKRPRQKLSIYHR